MKAIKTPNGLAQTHAFGGDHDRAITLCQHALAIAANLCSQDKTSTDRCRHRTRPPPDHPQALQDGDTELCSLIQAFVRPKDIAVCQAIATASSFARSLVEMLCRRLISALRRLL
ncbi:hypothetical protein [[Actinomadura] parvosata]|uniref:hypothetical protein n=1 Tax=[Actinomadura] parvosata TaxID=1955412 RepID=UPI0016446235